MIPRREISRKHGKIPGILSQMVDALNDLQKIFISSRIIASTIYFYLFIYLVLSMCFAAKDSATKKNANCKAPSQTVGAPNDPQGSFSKELRLKNLHSTVSTTRNQSASSALCIVICRLYKSNVSRTDNAICHCCLPFFHAAFFQLLANSQRTSNIHKIMDFVGSITVNRYLQAGSFQSVCT